ncbi:hypothetical protein D9M71_562820 [compost metagenome]
MRQEQGQQVLVGLVEGRIVAPAADANAALGAVRSVDVGAEHMEHVGRLHEALVEVRVQPLVHGDELGERDHLAVGQVDEGIEAIEMLVIGAGDLLRGPRGGDAQAVHMLARRAQDEGGVLGGQQVLELVQEGVPGHGFQGTLIEMPEHVAEAFQREQSSHDGGNFVIVLGDLQHITAFCAGAMKRPGSPSPALRKHPGRCHGGARSAAPIRGAQPIELDLGTRPASGSPDSILPPPHAFALVRSDVAMPPAA